MIYLENESYMLGKALHKAQKYAMKSRHEFLTPDHLLWAIAEQDPFRRVCVGYEIQAELIDHINQYEQQVPEDVEYEFPSPSVQFVRLINLSQSVVESQGRRLLCRKSRQEWSCSRSLRAPCRSRK